MEVHPHTHTERKKWTHYFWEFFMLFLAVTLGFFVENQREHYIETKRETQYIRSFTDDLKKDIFQLDSLIVKRETRKVQIDSIHFILTSPDPDLYGNQLYFYARYLPRPFVFINNDATIQQLKNSGNLRLIRNQAAVDIIMDYDRQFRFMETIKVREDQLIMRIFNFLDKLFDPEIFDKMNVYDIEFVRPPGNPRLLTRDPELIRNFLSEVNYLKTVNIGQIGWFIKQKERAKSTLEFLQKEYRLKAN
jgi:hypothetical protein